MAGRNLPKVKTPLSTGKLQRLLKEPQVKSWRALMGAFQRVYRTLEAELHKEGCSISRFQILFHLYFYGPLPAVEIARRLLVTRGNISTFLKRIQSERLIEVSELSVSRKRPLFSLTKKGERQFEELFPRHISRVKRLVPVLKPEMLRTLERISSSGEEK